MNKTATVSILIPVYNEEKTIEHIIKQVQKQNYSKLHLNAQPDIVVVDDCSTDRTSTILQAISKSIPIRVIKHATNQGKGAAIRTGFASVIGTFIIIQDADLEYNPIDYPRLLKPLTDKSADVVFGNRMRLKVLPEFYVSLFGNKLLTSVTNLLFGSRLSDVFVGYKAFTHESIKNAQFTSNRFDIEIELTAHFLKNKRRIREVPISYHGRSWSEGKKITVRDGVLALLKIFQYRLFS